MKKHQKMLWFAGGLENCFHAIIKRKSHITKDESQPVAELKI